jgi:hypothetical protein
MATLESIGWPRASRERKERISPSRVAPRIQPRAPPTAIPISTTSFRKPPRPFPIPRIGFVSRTLWHTIKPV